MDYYAAPDDESSSHSDGSFADWGSEAEVEPAVCLFCSTVDTPRLVLEHCVAVHGLDVLQVLRDKGNGDYDGIRLVNFVRRQVTEGVSAASIIERVSDLSSSIWTDDTLLVPVLESDPLLYCLEADEEDAAAAADVGVDPTLRVVGVRIAETK